MITIDSNGPLASPLVSIITVVYNGEQYIEQTIRSVLDQTYNNIQYIIVDGGSTDSTIDIINKFSTRLYRWVSEKDEGISDAFNKGIAMATGEIIALINADDWYEKDSVEKVVATIGNYDIAYGDVQYWIQGRKTFIQEGNHHFLINEMTVNHPTVFMKRKCYEKFGPFDTSYRCAMDYDLMLRYYTAGCTFIRVPAVVANMRWEGTSDVLWKQGCAETLAIKNHYLPQKKFKNKLYYYRHLLAIGMPKLLGSLRMGFIAKFYRSRFSRLKKTYDH
ncbi:MAG TPA: glycosyltransferase family 2 protein [Flavitalea sp.]|nr:glycosyltransferase family 2 protein [Flavitalea sp.]